MLIEIERAQKEYFYKVMNHDPTDFEVAMCIFAVADCFAESDKKYINLYLATQAEKRTWQDALEVISESLTKLDTIRRGGEKNLNAAESAVNSKINPAPQRSEIEKLLIFQKQAEARQILSGLSQSDRLKAIDAALERDDRFLLDVMIESPVITDTVEQRLLEERKVAYEEGLSARICQTEFKELQAVRKMNKKLEASLATARNAIFHICDGRWKVISTSLRDELLSNANSRSILQRVGLNILR